MHIVLPVAERASRDGASPALVLRGGATITYDALDASTRAVAAKVRAAGVAPGMVVTVDLASPRALLVAILALARLGAAAAPPVMPASYASLHLGDPDTLPPQDARTVTFDREWLDAAPPIGDAELVGRSDAIAIVHATSGTTGQPHFVALDHARLFARLESLRGAVPMAERARVLCTARAISCYGFDTYLRVLHAGGTLVLHASPEDVMAALGAGRVEHLTANPLWIERVASAWSPDAPFAALARIESAGSHLAGPLAAIARMRLCGDVWNHYGTTEAGCIAAAPMRGNDADATLRAAPGIEVGAIGADGARLPPGQRGRLGARGPGVAARYLGDDTASADAFRGGWHVTADEGTASADGELRLDGRVGEAVNVGGYKVSPRTIEDALLAIRGVRDAAVFGVASAAAIDELWAAVVVAPATTLAALHAEVGRRLGALAPRVLITIDAIPRNDAGKVRRDELVARAHAARGSKKR